MKRILLILLMACSLGAQTVNPVADAQQVLTDVTNLTAQLAAANATIAANAAVISWLGNAGVSAAQSEIKAGHAWIGIVTTGSGSASMPFSVYLSPEPMVLPPTSALVTTGSPH